METIIKALQAFSQNYLYWIRYIDFTMLADHMKRDLKKL